MTQLYRLEIRKGKFWKYTEGLNAITLTTKTVGNNATVTDKGD